MLSADGTESESGGLLGSVLFPSVPRESDGSVHLDAMRAYSNQQRNSLSARIQEALKEAGIDTSRQIRLETGREGSVVVANDHPQRDEIEQIFRERRDLRDRFVEIDTLSSFVRSGDEAIAFQQAYSRNPYAAMAQYSYLFDGSPRPQFSLLVQKDQAAIDFVS